MEGYSPQRREMMRDRNKASQRHTQGREEEAEKRAAKVFKNGQTLVCANQRFELGFFNVSSTNDHNHKMWYLGLWYREIKLLTAVWVGIMMKPLRGFGMRLVLNSVGDLLLRDDVRTVIWFVGVVQPASRPELVLLDSGNLVIKDGDNLSDGGFVWQSFDFPSNTLLPGMKGFESRFTTCYDILEIV
ncbi:S-locus related protein SLR1 [Forsythia ovata]|uniref:S-locus related protein SLR1 n=1 Tax=Forsythia ovata TaxID=205694 RepID=A0ABD1S5S7_9LAMI